MQATQAKDTGVKLQFYIWQHLKQETRRHPMSHDCEKCKKRRRLAHQLHIPHSGPVTLEMVEAMAARNQSKT